MSTQDMGSIALHNLGSMLTFRILETLKNGTRQGETSAFLIETCRRDSTLDPMQCVLKIYHTPNKSLNSILYSKELASNTMLSQPWAAPTAEQAVDDMFRRHHGDDEGSSSSLYYPRCFGTVSVPDESLVMVASGKTDWLPFNSKKKLAAGMCAGFLIEYLSGLRIMTKADVTPDRAMVTMKTLGLLHAENIRHGNLEDPSAYPDVGFANIFIREGDDGVFILDFNRAKVMSNSQKHQDFLKDEETRMRATVDRAMSNEDPWEGLPSETRKLLGGSQARRA